MLSNDRKKSKEELTSLESLWFYFDSIERDRLDFTGLDRKSSQLITLRSKLLKLSEAKFDAAIKTIEKLVEDTVPTTQREERERQNRKASLELFERTAAAGEAPRVDQISRIT
jgi:hypothetical protein